MSIIIRDGASYWSNGSDDDEDGLYQQHAPESATTVDAVDPHLGARESRPRAPEESAETGQEMSTSHRVETTTTAWAWPAGMELRGRPGTRDVQSRPTPPTAFPQNRVLREGDQPCLICGSGPDDHGARNHPYRSRLAETAWWSWVLLSTACALGWYLVLVLSLARMYPE